MKRSLVTAFCCASLCAMTAWGQTNSVSQTDQEFINTAAQTDMMEAHMGQVAQDKGGTQGVKDFGQTLVTDHTNDYQQLSQIATKDGATVPKGLDATRDRMIAPLEKLSGAAFDRKFVQAMIAGHEKAISEYEREAKDGQNPDIKNYASQALPTLHKHLDTARSLEGAKGHTHAAAQ